MTRLPRRWRLPAALTLAGLGCLLAFALSDSYLDADGVLHEAFYLLAIGWGLLLAGASSAALTALCSWWRRR